MEELHAKLMRVPGLWPHFQPAQSLMDTTAVEWRSARRAPPPLPSSTHHPTLLRAGGWVGWWDAGWAGVRPLPRRPQGDPSSTSSQVNQRYLPPRPRRRPSIPCRRFLRGIVGRCGQRLCCCGQRGSRPIPAGQGGGRYQGKRCRACGTFPSGALYHAVQSFFPFCIVSGRDTAQFVDDKTVVVFVQDVERRCGHAITPSEPVKVPS